MVSNFLPPDSQPWVRALENKIKTLETTITSLKKATTSRVSSAVTTPGNVLTLGGEKVPGEGVLNGSLEHLNGVYTLRYGHEFHGLTQYVLIVSGKASGAGELSLLGPEGQVLDSDTLETDVDDVNEFYFAVEFPILTMNYEFEPEDEDGGGPDTDQEVVSSYVLPDTGTLSLVTGATLSELSYEIRSANSSQVTIDTSSGVPAITGLSADGTTIDVMNSYSDTLEILEDALGGARQELADALAEAEQNFGTLDDKLGQAFPDDIFDVGLAIDAAMTMASGKNAVSYTDVSNSVAEPGPTPTQAMGEGRPVYDMHRNRRSSNGQIIGEWIWTGTAWTRLTMSDAMVSSLDVGKLTAGTANIETAVVNKLWGQLGVFDKLDVRTDAYISGINLKDGAVTARTMNVVPEDGQGGTVLTGTKIGMVNSDGTGMMDLSVDSDNYMSFYRDDSVNFSVSSDGALAAQDVSANNSLIYRGEELSGLIDPRPKGLIARSMLKNRVVSGGPWTELCSVTFTPEPGRLYRASGSVTVTSSAYIKGYVGIKFSTRSVFIRTWALPEYTANFSGSSTFEDTFTAEDTESGEQEVTLSLYGQSAASPSQIAFEGWDTSGSGKRSCYMTVEDIGAPVPWNFQTMESQKGEQVHTPVKTEKTASWDMSSFQNYRAGVRLAHASGNIAGGNYSGEWRGIMFFPHATIRSALSGATISKVEVYLQNAHTYASSGSTVLVGSHNYATAPSSSPAVDARTSQHFSRGQGRWVTLPTAVGTGFANGTIKGLAVYGSSTANYATWTPSAPKIRISYIK